MATLTICVWFYSAVVFRVKVYVIMCHNWLNNVSRAVQPPHHNRAEGLYVIIITWVQWSSMCGPFLLSLFSAAFIAMTASRDDAVLGFEAFRMYQFWLPISVQGEKEFSQGAFRKFVDEHSIYFRLMLSKSHSKNPLESKHGSISSIFLKLQANSPDTTPEIMHIVLYRYPMICTETMLRRLLSLQKDLQSPFQMDQSVQFLMILLRLTLCSNRNVVWH